MTCELRLIMKYQMIMYTIIEDWTREINYEIHMENTDTIKNNVITIYWPSSFSFLKVSLHYK